MRQREVPRMVSALTWAERVLEEEASATQWAWRVQEGCREEIDLQRSAGRRKCGSFGTIARDLTES